MRHTITVDVDVDIDEILEDLGDEDLKDHGLTRIVDPKKARPGAPAGFGRETPRVDVVMQAALHGDLAAFIEATHQLLREQELFMRTDRLLAQVREVAHA